MNGWGKLNFWLTFIGLHVTFGIQHRLGDAGMPRRYADYLPTDGFTTMHVVSTIGAFILGVSMVRCRSSGTSSRAGATENPSCRRFVGLRQLARTGDELPAAAAAQLHRAAPNPVRAPGLELHHPNMVERMRAEAHVGRAQGPADGDLTQIEDVDVRT